ncbi:hypothetical protein PNOK_0503000 [Pyrrhoderma noxium]|uniref:Uncharacterized protein n=1 Tax=Pyrrhoderma noxium TaxID=2282107 RepID=A0A286UKF1_9AGAM|nr:hypothetical protein PNOK_0503000 [Pyrrhoderma noxium]
MNSVSDLVSTLNKIQSCYDTVRPLLSFVPHICNKYNIIRIHESMSFFFLELTLHLKSLTRNIYIYITLHPLLQIHRNL